MQKIRIMQTARFAVFALVMCSIACALGTAQAVKKAVAGQKITTVIDRPETLVLKTDLEPGAVVPAHTQTKIKFYLFLPITSGIELTIGSEQPVITQAAEAYFILPGVPYSFRNPGTTSASAFELTVNDTGAPIQKAALAPPASPVLAPLAPAQAPNAAPAQTPDGAAPEGRGAGRGPGGRGAGRGGNAGGGAVDRITRSLDRAEVRVLRNETGPGLGHPMHSHDDVGFHFLLGITSGTEVTVGTGKPFMLDQGQGVYIPGRTLHAFRNPGTVPVVTYEVFINEGPTAPATLTASKKSEPGPEMALVAANEIK